MDTTNKFELTGIINRIGTVRTLTASKCIEFGITYQSKYCKRPYYFNCIAWDQVAETISVVIPGTKVDLKGVIYQDTMSGLTMLKVRSFNCHNPSSYYPQYQQAYASPSPTPSRGYPHPPIIQTRTVFTSPPGMPSVNLADSGSSIPFTESPKFQSPPSTESPSFTAPPKPSSSESSTSPLKDMYYYDPTDDPKKRKKIELNLTPQNYNTIKNLLKVMNIDIR